MDAKKPRTYPHGMGTGTRWESTLLFLYALGFLVAIVVAAIVLGPPALNAVQDWYGDQGNNCQLGTPSPDEYGNDPVLDACAGY